MTEIFSHNLRNALYMKGMTQSGLAKAVKTTETSVSKWINGAVVPRPKMVDEICRVLKVTRADLMIDREKTALSSSLLSFARINSSGLWRNNSGSVEMSAPGSSESSSRDIPSLRGKCFNREADFTADRRRIRIQCSAKVLKEAPHVGLYFLIAESNPKVPSCIRSSLSPPARNRGLAQTLTSLR